MGEEWRFWIHSELTWFWKTWFSLWYLNNKTQCLKAHFGGRFAMNLFEDFFPDSSFWNCVMIYTCLIWLWGHGIWGKELILQGDSIQIIHIYYWPHKCSLTYTIALLGLHCFLPFQSHHYFSFSLCHAIQSIIQWNILRSWECLFDPALWSVQVTGHIWLLRIWNVGSCNQRTESLN